MSDILVQMASAPTPAPVSTSRPHTPKPTPSIPPASTRPHPLLTFAAAPLSIAEDARMPSDFDRWAKMVFNSISNPPTTLGTTPEHDDADPELATTAEHGSPRLASQHTSRPTAQHKGEHMDGPQASTSESPLCARQGGRASTRTHTHASDKRYIYTGLVSRLDAIRSRKYHSLHVDWSRTRDCIKL